MKTAALNTDGSRNGFVSAEVGPLNRSSQSRFGLVDVAIIAGLLLITAGVLGLLLRVVIG